MTVLMQLCEPGETPLPHADAVAVGIDLGTTHSVVAVASEQGAEAIHDASGKAIIPSAVWFHESERHVGYAAREAALRGERDVITSAKRLMGKSAADLRHEALPYAIAPEREGLVRMLVAGKPITPIEVSADILRHLKQMAETALGRSVGKAVITVPAYFDDAARAATKDAATLAGLQVLRLINEPTAAALAYGLNTHDDGLVAIYDMGGGTFDISILKLHNGVFQVLATAGDTALGGDDMDHAIAEYVLKTLKLTQALTPSQRGQLIGVCRQAKERLSEVHETEIHFDGACVPFTVGQLETLVADLIARSMHCCELAVHDANLTPQAIGNVVLVGGATRMPMVKQAVAQFFGKQPLDSVDPDLTVALGAALQAQALTKGADHLLLDVTPLSLGIETMGGVVEKLIHRNSPIPAAVAQEFTTYKDGQSAMKIHVVQGEREKASDCRSLGQFELRGIPPLPAGIARIRVAFALDADGLLTVSAKELTTNVAQEIVVKPAYGLAFEEIERMLAESVAHARADITERLLIEARVEAQRTIEELLSAITADANLLKIGEEAMMRAQIERVTKACQGADRERIDYEREELNKLAGPFAERRMDAAIRQGLAGHHIEHVG